MITTMKQIIWALFGLLPLVIGAAATAAVGQAGAFVAVAPQDTTVCLYRQGDGTPRIEVNYKLKYSDGESTFTRHKVTNYDEPDALIAGYTEEQVAAALSFLTLVEGYTYTVNGLSIPVPTPVPTPAPTPAPTEDS